MLRENKFEDDAHLGAVEYGWGTLIRFVLPKDLSPWQVWLDIEWPEVRPGLPVLLAGVGPDWFERELEQHYTSQASFVGHVHPRLALAPEEALKHVVLDLARTRIKVALEQGLVVGRSKPKE